MCAKFRPMVWRFGAFLSALSLCFVFSVPCFAASTDSNPDVAAELTWRSYIGGVHGSGFLQKSVAAPFYGSNSPFATYTHSGYSVDAGNYVNGTFSRFELSSADWFSGAIGLYTSFYFIVGDGNISGTWQAVPAGSAFADKYQFFYVDHLGTEHVTSLTSSGFTPVVFGSSVSPGYTFKASFVANQAEPISALGFKAESLNEYLEFHPTSVLSNPTVSLVFPSCTVVVTSNSDELAALENMADSIAQQNQIMSQFYGEVIQVCNQIYQRLGDLQAAQEEANSLFSQVINILNTTNGKLSAINQAMSTYFEILIAQLKQEGIDTRTAIADAEARLEAYLKPMIDYFNQLEETTGESASTLPQHKTDLDKFGSDDGYGISDDGQTGLMAIMPVFSAFSFVFSILAFFIGLGILGIIIRRGMS